MEPRTVRYPDIKDFSAFIETDSVRPWSWKEKGEPDEPIRLKGLQYDRRPQLWENFVTVRGGRSFYARPSELTLSNTDDLFTGGSLLVTVRNDGTALVTIQEAQILGGVWLALVDASTLPAQEVKA